jgi:hypothetical protein
MGVIAWDLLGFLVQKRKIGKSSIGINRMVSWLSII